MVCPVIIQARMGSKRYPGKSMYMFNGKPSLMYLVESLEQCVDKKSIWVATSEMDDNDPIRELCRINSINVYSGDEDNVAKRYYDIVERIEGEYFIRVNGDSPLFDYRIMDTAIKEVDGNYDLYSTIYTRRFPSGMNFEIIRRALYVQEYPGFHKAPHFEHVTKYFYENRHKYRIKQVPYPAPDPGKYKFSFDTEEDRNTIRAFLAYIDKPHYCYSLAEKCDIYDKMPRA